MAAIPVQAGQGCRELARGPSGYEPPKMKGRNVSAGGTRYDCQLPAHPRRTACKHFSQLSFAMTSQSQNKIQGISQLLNHSGKNVPHVNRCFLSS